MTRKQINLPLKRVFIYMGDSRDVINGFPVDIGNEIAVALEVSRLGGKHNSSQPWHGLGSGVFEIALDDGVAYRTVYTVQFKEAVYVLHAFQKKSTQGI